MLVAGFSSPHRAIVNETVLFWNETFCNEQSIAYPTKLESVLRARVVDADISLPTFPDSNVEHVPATLPPFFDSQSQISIDRPVSKAGYDLVHNKLTGNSSQFPAQSAYFTAQHSSVGPRASFSSAIKKAIHSSGSSTPKARLRHDDSQIQFAPIDSSPLPPADESQLLTEHQKEVKIRQQQSAQLFPDFSSSPMAQSTALPKTLPKRLNFASHADQQEENEAPGTPTGLPDVNGLVSDDMPSSPTPSSTKDASQGVMEMEEDKEAEEVPQDPPSSPPQAAEDEDNGLQQLKHTQYEFGPDDAPVEAIDFAETNHEDTVEDEEVPEAQQAPENGSESQAQTDEMVSASEFPSDSQLPTAQLQLEAEADVDAQESIVKMTGLQARKVAEPQENAQADRSQKVERAHDAEDVNSESQSASTDSTSKTDEGEVTRVENSFIEPSALGTEAETQSNTGGQHSQRTNRKRKRPSSIVYTAKKRKQQSPFTRVFSSFNNFLRRSQEEEDDDMEEEIVVASSQPSSSPATNRTRQATGLPSKMTNAPVDPTEELKEEIDAPPPKPGRGRPRKSETPTPSQPLAGPARSLKRMVSTLSNASASESRVATSFVKDTPAPIKTRKQREGHVGKATRASKSSHRVPGTIRPARRTVAAVVVESTVPASQQGDAADDDSQLAAAEEEENPNLCSPEKQLADEQAAAFNDRPILTPRSILGRLRNALSDLGGMILGSQDERNFDDVLFELRRATHEAARRGRE